MALIAMIVLTRDEEENLPNLLASLAGLDVELHVVDSGSTDRTIAIAEGVGAIVHHRAWISYAEQFNWALDTIVTKAPWMMRMDADERLSPELVAELMRVLPGAPASVGGYRVKRQVWFWGRWIRHGGYYPTWLVRVWRTGSARIEDRWMDEHVVLSGGEIADLAHDIIDENHKGLGFWTAKHNLYADREVRDILAGRGGADGLDAQARRTRRLKEGLYLGLPPFFRAWAYWAYRYLFRGGFRDGLPGLVFHFLQGFWYRFLVDAKLHERSLREARIVSSRPISTRDGSRAAGAATVKSVPDDAARQAFSASAPTSGRK